MKKQILILELLCVLLCCVGCHGGQEEDNYEKESIYSIASEGLNQTEAIPTCPLITKVENFKPVEQDQTFQFGIDHNTRLNTYYGLAEAEDNFYLLSLGASHIFYADNEMKHYDLLCGKPDCQHVDEVTCQSYVMESVGLAFYDSALYTLNTSKLKMKKISLDGSERKTACSISGIPENEIGGDARNGYNADCIFAEIFL